MNIYILESSGRPLGGLDSSTILDHVQTFQIVNIGQPTHAPLVSEKRLKNSLRTLASHTERQIYIILYKEIILTVAASGGLVLRSITQGHQSFTLSAMNLGRVLIRKGITWTIKILRTRDWAQRLLCFHTGQVGGMGDTDKSDGLQHSSRQSSTLKWRVVLQ